MEAFAEAVTHLPQWVQHWMDFIAFILAVSLVVFAIVQPTRWIALYLLITTVLMLFVMTWMYGQMGLVRLLGVAHVVFWTPLVIYLWRRLKSNPPHKYVAIVMWVLMLTLTGALIFDYYDVARWLMGERASII